MYRFQKQRAFNDFLQESPIVKQLINARVSCLPVVIEKVQCLERLMEKLDGFFDIEYVFYYFKTNPIKN